MTGMLPIDYTTRDWVCSVSTSIPIPDDGLTEVEYWFIIVAGIDNAGCAMPILHVFVQQFEAQARSDKLRAVGIHVVGPIVHKRVYPK